MNLTRTIIACIIVFTLLPITLNAYRLISNIDFNYNETNDEICLMQLREILLIAYDLRINTSELTFLYQNKTYSLSLINRALVLSPGYQMYLNDVDDLYFESKDNCLYLNYERKNKKYQKVIGTNIGLYLDEFSYCPIESDDSSDGES